MTSPQHKTRSERIYRALMSLYPRRFRDLYEQDAVELFRDRLTEARQEGLAATAWLWLRTVPNALVHGALERLAALGQSDSRPDRGAALWGAARSLVRSPGLSLAIVLTLGIGIGANVALYSVLRSVLLKPLPYPDSEQLVQLWEQNPDVDAALHGPSPWNFIDWEREVGTLESMAAWYLTSGTYRTEGWVEELRSAQVTPDFFRTLGVAPLIGRDFRAEEVTGYGPVMLSHRVWQRLFGGDPSVVGQSIISSGNSYEIVGVMPADFAFPDESVETWVAWHMPAAYEGNFEARTWRFLSAMGRVPEGTTITDVERELDGIASSLAESHPEMNRGWGTAVTSLHEDTVGDVRGTLWMSFGAVLFILLIACANAANLLLARVPARLKALTIRQTLGATRTRIAQELIAENALLAGAAALLGLGLGALFIDVLVALDAGRIPRLAEVSIDPGVFGFTVAVAAVTSIVFGGAPLVQLLRRANDSMTQAGLRSTGASGQHRAREAFVGSQIAMALVLLAGAGVFAASLDRLMEVDPGLDPEGVAAFRVSLDGGAAGGAVGTVTYYEGLLERIAAIPGVSTVAASQTLALDPIGNDFQRPFRPSGSGVVAADASTVQMRIVTPGYVEAMGMSLLAGAGIPRAAELGEPLVAVINQTLAEQLWPSGNAVGRTFDIDFREGWQPYEIAGVVQDVRHYGLREATRPEVFLSHRQVPYIAMHVMARTVGEPEALFDELRETVRTHTPMQPAHNFVSLEGLVASSTAEERFLSVLLTLFAGIGLLLSTTGVYGVIAYTVSHRRREIGVRMALGAEPQDVVQGVLRRALVMAGLGIGAGLVAVFFLSGVVEALLFGVSPLNPPTMLGVAALLAMVAAVAAWLPARRAAWIAPAEALRSE